MSAIRVAKFCVVFTVAIYLAVKDFGVTRGMKAFDANYQITYSSQSPSFNGSSSSNNTTSTHRSKNISSKVAWNHFDKETNQPDNNEGEKDSEEEEDKSNPADLFKDDISSKKDDADDYEGGEKTMINATSRIKYNYTELNIENMTLAEMNASLPYYYTMHRAHPRTYTKLSQFIKGKIDPENAGTCDRETT